ncbi:hypothetical protein G9A89_018747, partial [Geosiphon pyriformis]
MIKLPKLDHLDNMEKIDIKSSKYFHSNEDWSLLAYLKHRQTQEDFQLNKSDEHFYYVKNLMYIAENCHEEDRNKAKKYLGDFMNTRPVQTRCVDKFQNTNNCGDLGLATAFLVVLKQGAPIDMARQTIAVVCRQAAADHPEPVKAFWRSLYSDNHKNLLELEKLRYAENALRATNNETEVVRSISAVETELLLKRKSDDDGNKADNKRNSPKIRNIAQSAIVTSAENSTPKWSRRETYEDIYDNMGSDDESNLDIRKYNSNAEIDEFFSSGRSCDINEKSLNEEMESEVNIKPYIKEAVESYYDAKRRNAFNEAIFWRIIDITSDTKLKISNTSRVQLQTDLNHNVLTVLSQSTKALLDTLHQLSKKELQKVAHDFKVIGSKGVLQQLARETPSRKLSAKQRLKAKLEGQTVDSETIINDDEPQLASVDPTNSEIIWIFDVLYEVCTNIEQGIPTRTNTERDNALDGTNNAEGSRLDWLFSACKHNLGKDAYWGREFGLAENTGSNVGNKYIKSKKNLRDMMCLIDGTLPSRGRSPIIDKARSRMILPALIFLPWRFHVITLSALNQTWCGVSDLGCVDIPTTFDEIHEVLKCCTIMLHNILQETVEIYKCCIDVGEEDNLLNSPKTPSTLSAVKLSKASNLTAGASHQACKQVTTDKCNHVKLPCPLNNPDRTFSKCNVIKQLSLCNKKPETPEYFKE